MYPSSQTPSLTHSWWSAEQGSDMLCLHCMDLAQEGIAKMSTPVPTIWVPLLFQPKIVFSNSSQL